MYKVFIIEDEIHAQKELEILLNTRNNIDIIGSCTSVKEALIILSSIQVDLVLMDVQLDDGKSFEILEKLEEVNFDVIFITAYNEFAINAIKIGALDYILKPIDEQEFHQAINLFEQKKEHKITHEQKHIVLRHSNNKKAIEKIVLKTLEATYFIDINQILFCKGDGNYTTFYLTENREITTSKPLKEYYSFLPKNQFIKTHQSYVVNKVFITSYNNNYELILINETSVPVSMRRKESVIAKLSE